MIYDSFESEKLKKLIDDKIQFFSNRADGYLFLISSDLNTIEILIIPNGRQLIKGYAGMLADGVLNEALNELRKSEKIEQRPNADLPILVSCKCFQKKKQSIKIDYVR